MTLGPEAVCQSREQVWAKFKTTFTTLYDLVAYKPFFKQYVYRLLEELYEDNVFYTELRGKDWELTLKIFVGRLKILL